MKKVLQGNGIKNVSVHNEGSESLVFGKRKALVDVVFGGPSSFLHLDHRFVCSLTLVHRAVLLIL